MNEAYITCDHRKNHPAICTLVCQARCTHYHRCDNVIAAYEKAGYARLAAARIVKPGRSSKRSAPSRRRI